MMTLINAKVIESLMLFKQQGYIRVVLNVVKDSDDGLKGILTAARRWRITFELITITLLSNTYLAK